VPRIPRHDYDTDQAAHALIGTPGSSKGTMASRAVGRTPGTHINGANPGKTSQDAPDAMNVRGLAGPSSAFRA
jgi:hypothetical protein